MKQKVVLTFLGSTLDAKSVKAPERHSVWRPTFSLATLPDLRFERIELFFDRRFQRLANIIVTDVTAASKNPPEICQHHTTIKDPWNFEEVYSYLYDFAEHYQFTPDTVDYYVHLTTGTHVAQICWFLLCESRKIPAKLLQTSPPKGKEKPTYSVIDLDLERYGAIRTRFEKTGDTDRSYLKSGIATRNQRFNLMIEEIEHVAKYSSDPLLLMGPTGAGKSHLAKKIYELKKNKHTVSGDFVALNCATLRGDQAMSALFGHTKGAFTGAVNKRDGVLKKADKGVLFLDEVGELGLDEQAMLLHAIEEKRFFPVGSDREEQSEFQLIVGTNKNLSKLVSQGSFREDLLARINTWSFTLPALAERKEDIEPNIEFELRSYELRHGRTLYFTAEAKSEYLEFAHSREALWLGNFRDLNASIARLATMATDGQITQGLVRKEIARLRNAWKEMVPVIDADSSLLASVGITPHLLDSFDCPQLAHTIRVLSRSSTIAEAGRELFAISRKSKVKSNDADRLRKYLARFSLDAASLLRRR